MRALRNIRASPGVWIGKENRDVLPKLRGENFRRRRFLPAVRRQNVERKLEKREGGRAFVCGVCHFSDCRDRFGNRVSLRRGETARGADVFALRSCSAGFGAAFEHPFVLRFPLIRRGIFDVFLYGSRGAMHVRVMEVGLPWVCGRRWICAIIRIHSPA